MAKDIKKTREEHATALITALRMLADQIEVRGLVDFDANIQIDRDNVEVLSSNSVRAFRPTGEVIVQGSWRLAPESEAVANDPDN